MYIYIFFVQARCDSCSKFSCCLFYVIEANVDFSL